MNEPGTLPQGPPAHPNVKKGMGTGAKIGIGCGAIVALIAVVMIVIAVVVTPKMKKFAKDAETNPTRAQAELTVSASFGVLEMSNADDANKRYTLKNTKNGQLTTVYWDEAAKAPKVVTGDFSAIPAPASP